MNIHEVLERVLSLVLAEYPDGIRLVRDYDTSLPDLTGDKEQLIQAVLNVVRNAAQAMQGKGQITLRTASLVRPRWRAAVISRRCRCRSATTAPVYRRPYVTRFFIRWFRGARAAADWDSHWCRISSPSIKAR